MIIFRKFVVPRSMENVLTWAACLAAIFIVVGVFLAINTPIPGNAVAVLGVGAVFMSLLPKLTPVETAAWMMALLLLLYVELKAIRVDREKASSQDIARRAELNKEFEKVLKENQEALMTITGGDSFPYIVPQPSSDQSLPLAILNAGSYPLTGVTVSIIEEKVFLTGDGFHDSVLIDVGTIAPHQSQRLTKQLMPKAKAGETEGYTFFITAQNGTFTQSLQVRRREGPTPWAYSYNAQKQPTGKFPTAPPPAPYSDLQAMWTSGWSDEPGFKRLPESS